MTRFVSLLAFGILLGTSSAAGAQNPDYTLRFPDLAGAPGALGDIAVVLENAGDPVEAWSFSLCYDTFLVAPLAIEPGADALLLNGSNGPDFFFGEFLANGVTNVAIPSLIGDESLGAGTHELVAITSRLDGPSGTDVGVAFCDTLGDPPIETLLVVHSAGVVPTTESGIISISGTPIPPSFVFSIPATNGFFDADTGVGTLELRPHIEQDGGFFAETTGFQMGIAHDATVLVPASVEAVGPLAALNGGTGPELLAVDLSAAGVTVDVEYSAGGETIVYDSPIAPVQITYDTIPAPLIGVPTAVPVAFSWSDSIGTPPIPNGVDLQGQAPATPGFDTGAAFLFPGPGGPSGEYRLSISDHTVAAGTEQAVGFFLDVTASGAAGWSWSVCHDNGIIELVEVVPGAAVPTLNGGNPPDFYTQEIQAGEGWFLGCVVNFLGAELLPAGTGYHMNNATYLATGTLGNTTEIVYCNTLGNPRVATIIVDGNREAVIPETDPGVIAIGSPVLPRLFMRGDVDGNGKLNGIADALFVLEYQFFAGSPVPPCLDAADADDDGTVDGLQDGIYILNYQFIPGSPPPPFPGAGTCGTDPTDDGIFCESPPQICI